MPSSNFYQLNEILELIFLTKPETTLDVGVGFGKYGLLAREYLELWDGREKYRDRQRKIDGIEVFTEFLTPLHDYIYDKIFVGDALEILSSLKNNYDLVLLIHILEHFSYEKGIKLIEQSIEHSRNLIISVPKTFSAQKDSFGNPYEVHKFHWKEKHFNCFANKFFIRNPYNIICYVGEDVLKVKKEFRKSIIDTKIKKYFPFIRIKNRFFKKVIRRLIALNRSLFSRILCAE
ncbi:MAG TPA: hypothetical protein EYP58_04925 [bacterium (Candidatus Stahlbacteria)]|nr:hypothetical protein [Candidatus Stahlbacteria bacterium]